MSATRPSKSIRGKNPFHYEIKTDFDPKVTAQAIIQGLGYLQKRLNWSGRQIAIILHLAPNTVNTWLKNGNVPITTKVLQPDIQAILHLLAIHRSLEAMFDDPENQVAWLSTLHPELNAVPLQLMGESIEGLIFIRQYLDYARGRGA